MEEERSDEELAEVESEFRQWKSAWIFTYGSLMWNPCFQFEERRLGCALGVRRSFCLYSWEHRGTPANPGLVLGLLPQHHDTAQQQTLECGCTGVVYRVKEEDKRAVFAALQLRENRPSRCYYAVPRPVRLLPSEGESGDCSGEREVEALVFMSITTHKQHAGDLEDEAVLAMLCDASRRGKSGTSLEYLSSTLTTMAQHSIPPDTHLHHLHQQANLRLSNNSNNNNKQ
eukprot:TRINITY_DN395_c2_g1_i1.p1 TRINITY_DN395_c2_g1~~TRINITY_DN395_c2_g1_i1.p1  ORF type:complete len:229 (+),score=48.56 TRINITY_DN395_c2_g1_i1:60-746(+)